jgi:uncharacterized membrane protein SpoIIM required for sporulation
MKETVFIEKKKHKWHEFEKLSKEGHQDPDKLSELFIKMTEDLSYARTFYPKRSVRVYLNFLAQKVYNSFNEQKKYKVKKHEITLNTLVLIISLYIVGASLGFIATSFFGLVPRLLISIFIGSVFIAPLASPNIRHFFLVSLPIEMYRSRKQLLTAFLFFSVAMLIGVVSSYIDPEFSRVILGDSYVDMTIDNINEGDPMAVYKQKQETSMFLGITINNIRVAFFAFILGVFFSVGTVFLLVNNGIMLGAFQCFFYIKGLFLTSFLTIWIHGTLEISAIIIAGCAGMVLGNGLLFPKTLTRQQSFQINVRRGMKILLGTVPIFIVAGFLEGFVTRQTDMPDILKWVIILFSFAFIVGYFVIYPIIVAKQHNFDGKIIGKPVYKDTQKIKKYRIRDLGAIFYDTFGFYRMHFKTFGKIIIQITLPLNLLFLILMYSISSLGGYLMNDNQNIGFALAFGEDFSWVGFGGNLVLLSLNIATVQHALSVMDKTTDSYFKIWIKHIWPMFFKTLPFMAGILLLIAFVHTGVLLLILFLSPFFVLSFYPAITGKFLVGLSKGINYGGKSWGITFVTFLMIGAISFLFYFGALVPVRFFLDEIINWHTTTTFDNFVTIQNIATSFMYISLIHLILPLLFSSFAFQFFSMREQEEAIELNERLDNFGKTSKIYESN